jgi:Flp pilus assembly pilin Flp
MCHTRSRLDPQQPYLRSISMRRQLSAAGRLFARLWCDERGGESLEYGFILGLLGMGAYVLMQGVGAKILDLWQRIDAALGTLG